jgi:glycosyltransferase involved in cell wall biosynthesis
MSVQFGDDALCGAAATRSAATPERCLFAVTPTAEECGVEAFARLLLRRLQAAYPQAGYGLLAVPGRWRDVPAVLRKIAGADRVVFSMPLAAWKNLLLLPLAILLFARLARCRVDVFMHEWTALHWLRRLALAPFALLGHSIIVVSPFVAAGLKESRWLSGAAAKCALVPNAPTVSPPAAPRVTERVVAVRRAARNCDVVIGSFGAIYKGKAPMALLDLAAHLRRRGMRALLLFIGSFPPSVDGYERQFWSKVAEYGLQSQVIVTGYVADQAELYTLFDEVGAFLFLFPEGLTARRSSVIHCLQSGRPVVVTAPRSMAEFAHHQGFTALIEAGALSFVADAADLHAVADQLLAVAKRDKSAASPLDGETWWRAAAGATHAVLSGADPSSFGA